MILYGVMAPIIVALVIAITAWKIGTNNQLTKDKNSTIMD